MDPGVVGFVDDSTGCEDGRVGPDVAKVADEGADIREEVCVCEVLLSSELLVDASEGDELGMGAARLLLCPLGRFGG